MAKPQKPTYLEEVRDAVMGQMKGVREHMREYSPTPIDTRERPAKEQASLWQRANALPDDLRQNIMGQMAYRAGHKDGESVPCSWCQYATKQATNGGG